MGAGGGRYFKSRDIKPDGSGGIDIAGAIGLWDATADLASKTLITAGDQSSAHGKLGWFVDGARTIYFVNIDGTSVWYITSDGHQGYYHSVDFQSIFRYYNNRATAGIGVGATYGIDNRHGVTSADGAPITLYAVPVDTGLYELTVRIAGTAGTVSSAIYQYKWTEGGHTYSGSISISAVSTQANATLTIQPDTGTNVTVQLTTLSGSGATVKVGASIQELAE